MYSTLYIYNTYYFDDLSAFMLDDERNCRQKLKQALVLEAKKINNLWAWFEVKKNIYLHFVSVRFNCLNLKISNDRLYLF